VCLVFRDHKLISITPPIKNDVTTDNKLVAFAVTDVGQLIAVYNNESAVIKVKSFVDGVIDNKWFRELPPTVSYMYIYHVKSK